MASASGGTDSSPKKVFDITTPNKVKPDASSRPIIVGHRPLVQDPMVSSGSLLPSAPPVSEAPTTPSNDGGIEVKPVADRKKIVPLTDEPIELAAEVAIEPETAKPKKAAPKSSVVVIKDEPVAEATDDPPQEPKPPEPVEEPTISEEEEPAAAPPEESPAADTESSEDAEVATVAGQVKDKLQEAKQAQADIAKQEAIEKMIASKEYYLPIGEAARKRSSRAGIVILLLLIIVAAGAYLAVDYGLFDPGFDVPYHFIKQ